MDDRWREKILQGPHRHNTPRQQRRCRLKNRSGFIAVGAPFPVPIAGLSRPNSSCREIDLDLRDQLDEKFEAWKSTT